VTVLELCIVLSLMFGLSFLWYVAGLVITFLRAEPDARADPSGLAWHFFLPARDEAVVIAGTLAYLRSRFPAAVCWVVDDDSRDQTAAIVERIAREDPGVRLLRRCMPDARTGKGDALNAAYLALCASLEPGTSRAEVVVCVVDADGRPSANLLEVCAGARIFGDPRIGAAQVEVRMSNRDVRRPLPGAGALANRARAMLARLQDVEFRGPISAMQMFRARTGTVNLGGNGQLVRLTALDELAGEHTAPWGNALLEDFEIGLRLMLSGWKIAYTVGAWVDQEALWNLRPLLVQRTRWAQGSMQCLRYLPGIWRSSHLSNIGIFEICYFMAQPWLQLIGTVVFPVPVLVFCYNAVRFPRATEDLMWSGGATMLLLYLMIGVGEFAVWGWLYRRRCEPGLSRRHALGIGLALTCYSWLTYVIAWRRHARLATGRSGWRKTRRNAEPAAAGANVPAQAGHDGSAALSAQRATR
jgi:cellulose synthase/poly-beta-1,6-N-acetylglucosamine synthase-like glycosyltransferase